MKAYLNGTYTKATTATTEDTSFTHLFGKLSGIRGTKKKISIHQMRGLNESSQVASLSEIKRMYIELTKILTNTALP